MQALTTLHKPEPDQDLERARERLAFDELLVVQIQLLLRRSFIRSAQPDSGPCNTDQAVYCWSQGLTAQPRPLSECRTWLGRHALLRAQLRGCNATALYRAAHRQCNTCGRLGQAAPWPLPPREPTSAASACTFCRAEPASMCRMPRSQREAQGIVLEDTSLLELGKRALPFQLTGGQEEALQQILDDMRGPAPMLRLLQVWLALSIGCCEYSRRCLTGFWWGCACRYCLPRCRTRLGSACMQAPSSSCPPDVHWQRCMILATLLCRAMWGVAKQSWRSWPPCWPGQTGSRRP